MDEKLKKFLSSGILSAWKNANPILQDDGSYLDDDGDKYWLNKAGDLHRLDGPAVIGLDGRKSWYLNGQRHRLDGPAIIYSTGSKYWFIHGQYHREDGPAIIDSDGRKAWFINGELHSYVEWYLKVNPDMSKADKVKLVMAHG